MVFKESSEIDPIKWNQLVNSTRYYSNYFYLNTLAKKWGAYVNEEYTKGVAVCYNEVLGIKLLYPILLGRFVEFFNVSDFEKKQLIQQLQKDFPVGSIQLPTEYNLLPNKKELVYQVCHTPERKLNTLSKRMLKKAEKIGLVALESQEINSIISIIQAEISKKVTLFDQQNQARFSKFIHYLNQQKQLYTISIHTKNNKVCGGLLFYKSSNELYYILGACTKEFRANGGMYCAMNFAIENALSTGKKIDFGGSNMPSIRQFYCGLGGKDVTYYHYEWDHSPWWFKILRFLKNKLNT